MRQLHFYTHRDNQPDDVVRPKNQFRAYSEAEKQFLQNSWQTMTNVEIAKSLSRSRSSVQSMGSNLGLKRTPEALSLVLAKQWKKTRNGESVAWTQAQIQFLIEHYATMSNAAIGRQLGRTVGAIKRKGAHDLGLRKSPELIKALAKRPNAGQFIKGTLPSNTVHEDEMVIRIRKNKRGPAYQYIRTGFKQWQQYHQWMWIRDHGPIPAGHIVVFRNGDQMDVRPDNLELITKRENAIRNSASLNLTDGYVAHTLAWHNPEGQKAMLEQPDLLALKRAQLGLDRQLKTHVSK